MLAERSIAAGLPKEFPREIRAAVEPHVVADYESGAWNFEGRGFLDYRLLKRHAPELYRDLKRFWKRPQQALRNVILCLNGPFRSEADAATRELTARGVLDIYEESVGDAYDVESHLEAVMRLLEATPDGAGVVPLLMSVSHVRLEGTLRPETRHVLERRLRAALDRDGRNCPLLGGYLGEISQVRRGANDPEWADYLRTLATRTDCANEYRVHVLGTIPRDFSGPFAGFRDLVYAWLREALDDDRAPIVEQVFSKWASQERERESLLPLMIRGLDSEEPRIQAISVSALVVATGTGWLELPYNQAWAGSVPRGRPDDRTRRFGAPNSPAEEWERFRSEMKIAKAHWKMWWSARNEDAGVAR